MVQTSAAGAQIIGIVKTMLVNSQVFLDTCIVTGVFNSTGNQYCTFGIDSASAGGNQITLINIQLNNILYTAADYSSLVLNVGTNATINITQVSVTGTITLQSVTTS